MIWIGDQLITLAPPPRKLTPEEAHAPAIERGAKCTSCPLFGCGRGPVLSTIREGAPLIAIGEAPGENEVREKRGFVGASGQVLDESLREGGLAREEISVSNVLLCQPPDGGGFTDYIENLKLEHARKLRAWVKRWAPDVPRDKQEEEAFANFSHAPDLLDAPPQLVLPQECCRPRLETDLRESNSRVVLAVGKQALDVCSDIFGLKRSKKPASLKKQHGAPVMLDDGRILISSYHPSFAFRGKRVMMPIIRMNIARAAKIAARGGQIDWSVPDFYIFQSKERFLQILRVFHETGAEVTVDIETNSKDSHLAHIYCVGVGAVIDGKEVIAVIPFNRKDGTPWWNEEDKIEVALALRAVLDDNPLVFQNGNYDITALLRVGLMTAKDKTHTDTLILHNNSIWNDLPHDLGFIARQYFEAPLWKKDVDHKTTSVTTDAELYHYNALDVLVTMRAVVELRKEIDKAETHAQLRTDIGNLPRIRQMSELGVFVNEWHRSELSEMLNRKCFQIEREFCSLVGAKINPRSVPQLQDLLFGKWKYEPVLSTDGFEWDAEEGDEVEDAATSSAALTALMKERRIDPLHALALNKLLAFRAYDKIRGTYVDNLPTYPLDLSAFGHVPWADRVVGPKYDEASERIWVRTILPKRPGLSLARTTYKNHITPSGRLASGDPLNLQNIPARGRGGLNLRDMFVAPPGHCFVGSDYCVHPSTRILTSALKWKAAGEVEPGDELIGFDEHGRADAKMRRSRVEAVKNLFKPCYEIETTRGTVVCSFDHMWLCRKPKQGRNWLRADEIQPGDLIAYFCAPWEEDRSYEGGYLAGFLDGEGYVGKNGSVGFGQNEGLVLDHVCDAFERRGFPITLSRTHGNCWKAHINGERNGIRVLGMLRPKRLLQKAAYCWEGQRTWSYRGKPAEVLAVRSVGIRPVVAIQTSTRTFVAEGMLSHNCQIEARIYAVVAQDEMLLWAIEQGLDIHTLNAASLLQKPGQDVMDVYRWINKQPPEEKKYFRTVAKRFCLAEGELVLTDRGEVPIEEVTTDDLVWDGVEWVTHDGVIEQGVQEVIEYEGLRATSDHEVWLEDGRKCRLGEAAERGWTLAEVYVTEAYAALPTRTAGFDGRRDQNRSEVETNASTRRRDDAARPRSYRTPIRSLAGDRLCLASRPLPLRARALYRRWLRSSTRSVLRQSHLQEVARVQFVYREEAGAEMATRPHERSATAVPEPERCPIRPLRRSRNRVSFRERAARRRLGDGQPGLSAGPISRSHRQRWALRTREPAVGRWDNQRRQSKAAQAAEGTESKVVRARVYDILNAGPRRRFTASRHLVSNCFL